MTAILIPVRPLDLLVIAGAFGCQQSAGGCEAAVHTQSLQVGAVIASRASGVAIQKFLPGLTLRRWTAASAAPPRNVGAVDIVCYCTHPALSSVVESSIRTGTGPRKTRKELNKSIGCIGTATHLLGINLQHGVCDVNIRIAIPYFTYNPIMILRLHHLELLKRQLADFPVVAILGARQVGKTTLAAQLEADWDGPKRHFDLEDPDDQARLADPAFVLWELKGLVVLDEIQLRPDIFPLLRVLADRPNAPARFLILGSAAPELLKHTAESLAGRVVFTSWTAGAA